jgi:hypothetical protein
VVWWYNSKFGVTRSRIHTAWELVTVYHLISLRASIGGHLADAKFLSSSSVGATMSTVEICYGVYVSCGYFLE